MFLGINKAQWPIE